MCARTYVFACWNKGGGGSTVINLREIDARVRKGHRSENAIRSNAAIVGSNIRRMSSTTKTPNQNELLMKMMKTDTVYYVLYYYAVVISVDQSAKRCTKKKKVGTFVKSIRNVISSNRKFEHWFWTNECLMQSGIYDFFTQAHDIYFFIAFWSWNEMSEFIFVLLFFTKYLKIYKLFTMTSHKSIRNEWNVRLKFLSLWLEGMKSIQLTDISKNG